MPDASSIYRGGKVAASSLGRYNICCPIVSTSVERQSGPTGHVFSHQVKKVPLRGVGRHRRPFAVPPGIRWKVTGREWERTADLKILPARHEITDIKNRSHCVIDSVMCQRSPDTS